MLDLARGIALVFALLGCVRPRYPFGALVGFALAVRLAVVTTMPLLDHSALTGNAGSGFAFVFLGPSALPMARSPIAFIDFIGVHHRLVTIAAGLLASAAAALAFRHARPLRPESDVARAWDRAGLRFVFVAVIEGMLVVLDVLLARLTADL